MPTQMEVQSKTVDVNQLENTFDYMFSPLEEAYTYSVKVFACTGSIQKMCSAGSPSAEFTTKAAGKG